MMPVVATPSRKVAELVIRAVAVRLLRTFWKSRDTPSSKMSCSCSSALNPLITLIPPRVSVSRPVTSALILPRFRKIGRMILNAFRAMTAKIARGIRAKTVMLTLIFSSNTRETTAVIVPPTN